MLSRSDTSNILNDIVVKEPERKIANESKKSINEELKVLFAKEQKISLSQARIARRSGFLKRASDDLYQSIETKEFWKINKANGTVERVIDVDQDGIAKE